MPRSLLSKKKRSRSHGRGRNSTTQLKRVHKLALVIVVIVGGIAFAVVHWTRSQQETKPSMRIRNKHHRSEDISIHALPNHIIAKKSAVQSTMNNHDNPHDQHLTGTLLSKSRILQIDGFYRDLNDRWFGPAYLSDEKMLSNPQSDWFGFRSKPMKFSTHRSGDLAMKSWDWSIPVRVVAERDLAVARNQWFLRQSSSEQQQSKRQQSSQVRITKNDNQNYSNVCFEINDNQRQKIEWEPHSSELCNWKNDALFWHSMHGTMVGWNFRQAAPLAHWTWRFAEELQKNKQCECPSNVAFVFADNREDSSRRLVERSYQMCNEQCHYFHVSQDYKPWDWFGKIGPLLELIESEPFRNQFDYVILTDADDQTLVRSPHDIIERFEMYDADMLVAGEDTNYPHWMREEARMESTRSPWSRHHSHVNAGGMMGKVKEMPKYLHFMKQDYLNFTEQHREEIERNNGTNKWRDQTCLKQMVKEMYPRIKVDSLCKIWTRVDIYINDL